MGGAGARFDAGLVLLRGLGGERSGWRGAWAGANKERGEAWREREVGARRRTRTPTNSPLRRQAPPQT